MQDYIMARLPGATGPTYMLEAVLTHVLDELVLSDSQCLLQPLRAGARSPPLDAGCWTRVPCMFLVLDSAHVSRRRLNSPAVLISLVGFALALFFLVCGNLT